MQHKLTQKETDAVVLAINIVLQGGITKWPGDAGQWFNLRNALSILDGTRAMTVKTDSVEDMYDKVLEHIVTTRARGMIAYRKDYCRCTVDHMEQRGMITVNNLGVIKPVQTHE